MSETPAEKKARLEAELRVLEVDAEHGTTGVSMRGLVDRAKERAEQTAVPASWGYRVALEEHEHFHGRWRGEAVDELNDRRVFLFWDMDGQACFSRSYAALEREIDRAAPQLGWTIVIYRGDDYTTAEGNSGFSFGVEVEPNEEPLPEDATVAADDDLLY